MRGVLTVMRPAVAAAWVVMAGKSPRDLRIDSSIICVLRRSSHGERVLVVSLGIGESLEHGGGMRFYTAALRQDTQYTGDK